MQLVARTPDWVRRPPGLVEQTRWLFCGLVLLSLLLTVPVPLSTGSGPSVLLAVVASLVLGVSWVLRYRQRGPALVFDVVEVLATLAFAAACPVPPVALTFAFPALWMRALYGSTGRSVAYCFGLAIAMAASLFAWPLLPGHDSPIDAALVLGGLPVFLVTVAVARHLALALIAREQSRDRDGVLVELSARLLGATDRDTIHGLAWRAANGLCGASPGVRVVVVRSQDHGLGRHQLHVLGTAGSFVDVPALLPTAVLSEGKARRDVWPAQDTACLDEAAGVVKGRWVCLAMPEPPEATMLIGGPDGVPPDALVAFQSMTNQVALALHTCDAHQDLAAQARTDSLTGLANRAAFRQALETALADGRLAPTVLFLDLDDFKTVNDVLGHAAGDEMLRRVADRLRSAVRPQDLCARLGGDEFAVLLRHSTPRLAEVIARRLVALIAEPVLLLEGPTPVGGSVGLATADPSVTAEQLMQRADVAMYAAKAQGKNRVQVFDPILAQRDGQVSGTDLAAAAAPGQPVVLHQPVVLYQPIVSTHDGRCSAFEAVVRWQHPVHGLPGPHDLLPVAEQTSTGADNGAAVLQEACAFIVGQAEDHGPLAVHVNVSAAQLLDTAYVDVVADCLRRFPLVDKQLVLEVTESMVLDLPPAQAAVSKLVALGAVLAIDDFGTGYSALTTLCALPLDTVKIDRSFVAGCVTNHTDRAVIEAVVGMASRLGLQTIAQGVDRLDQQQVLRRAGVGSTQGPLHGRPMDAPAATAWLNQHAPPRTMRTKIIALAAHRSS